MAELDRRFRVPHLHRVTSVWIGRDPEGHAAAVFYLADESRHYLLRDEGTWRLIGVSGPDDEEYDVEEQVLTLDPVEVAATLHDGDVVPPYDPTMN
jgi:hypothetical protein